MELEVVDRFQYPVAASLTSSYLPLHSSDLNRRQQLAARRGRMKVCMKCAICASQNERCH